MTCTAWRGNVSTDRADGFRRLLRDVETADPSVVLVVYGFSEASDGAAAVDRFGAGLKKLAGELTGAGRRVVLVTPFALLGFQLADYQQQMRRCREAVTSLGKQLELPVIHLGWQPGSDQLTEDRLLPNTAGYAELARLLAESLVGGAPCESISDALRTQIAAKNQLFFHRYRPQNETYLFLFRKHEQGNNAVEIPQFDPLIEEADRAIWRLAGADPDRS